MAAKKVVDFGPIGEKLVGMIGAPGTPSTVIAGLVWISSRTCKRRLQKKSKLP